MKLRQGVWRWNAAAGVASCLFLLLAVCGPVSAQSKLSAKDHQRLMSYVNTYNTAKLLADPVVKPKLARLLGPQVSHLKRNLSVTGPIGVQNRILTLSGNAPHQGMEENGFLGVNLSNGEVYAVLLTHGKFEIYKNATKYFYLPYPVRQWIEATWARLQLGTKDPPNIVMHPAR